MVVSTPRDLFTAANLKKFDCAWADKVDTAFFRGTATGLKTRRKMTILAEGKKKFFVIVVWVRWRSDASDKPAHPFGTVVL